jgi:hypothetical protein
MGARSSTLPKVYFGLSANERRSAKGSIFLQVPRVVAPSTPVRNRYFGEQRALAERINEQNKFVRFGAIADYKRLIVTSIEFSCSPVQSYERRSQEKDCRCHDRKW